MIDAITMENGKLINMLIKNGLNIENAKNTIKNTCKDQYKIKYIEILDSYSSIK